MIFHDSRYADSYIYKSYDARRDNYQVAISRVFPSDTAAFFFYTWVEGDRMDIVSFKFLGSPNFWWKIMDFNPEIIDALDIPVGTQIRIPNV